MVGLLGLSAPASAQIDTGSIVGTVRDSSGAVLPGVVVTATQEETSFAATATTNDKGQYVLPNLKVGQYTVSAELQGFKRSVRQAVPLHVQERVEVNFALGLGNLTEEVVVTGRADTLNKTTGDMGHVVDERQLKDLPLLGRRYAELALLQTGVVAAGQGVAGRGDDTFFNSNGNYATWNNFTLDGGDNNSFSTNLQERSLQVIQPPVDALEEFRIQTRTYSAEFGRSAGAVINASIKQGGNEYHGNLFGFMRDEALTSNTYENKRFGRPKGKFNQYIAGGTLGGPILKNRLFFFGDFQATRIERAVSDLATVPTPLMRQGNFTELQRPLRPSTPYAPASCFNGQIILPACIDPVSRGLMDAYPLPNIQGAIDAYGRPGGFVSPNYINNGILQNDVDQFDVRVDAKPAGAADSVFVRYSRMKTDRNEPPVLGPVASGDFNSHHIITGQSAVASWSHLFGGSMYSEVRGSWNQIDGDTFHHGFGIDANEQYGITGVPQDPLYSGGLPAFNIAGFSRLGGPSFRPQFQTSQVYQLAANLTWNRGSHTMKFGVERRRDKVDYIDLRALNGAFTFSDGRYTNAAIGDFLMGLVSTQGLTLFHEAKLHTDGWQLYAQDSWRPTSTLTLNYGLRYEFFTPMQDERNIMTNIDPATGQVVRASDSGSLFDRTLIQPDRNNFAPRVSFAWVADPKLVLRGGYGTYYQHTDRYGSESQLALNPPQLVDVNLLANSAADAPAAVVRNGFAPVSAANVNPAAVQWRIQDPDQKTPIIHQFSLGPEYALTSNMSFSIEYVGNLIRNGRRLRNLNQGIRQANGTVVFPYARYGFGNAFLEQIVTNGRANYHALQTKLQRRMTNGLGFTAAFTWSRALGDFLDHLSAGRGASGNFPQDAYNMSNDYGPLEFDIPKRLVLSFIYELPVGKGRGHQPGGVAGALLSDWSVNGILSLNDGRPFTVTSTDRTGVGGSGRISRADCLGDAQPGGFNRTEDAWFDVTQFREPAAGVFGNCGSNTVRAPGSKNLNVSLFRNFPLGGSRRLEFRAEAFNLFNWTNYGFPGASVSTPATFGRITTSLGDPREVQLAVKFYF